MNSATATSSTDDYQSRLMGVIEGIQRSSGPDTEIAKHGSYLSTLAEKLTPPAQRRWQRESSALMYKIQDDDEEATAATLPPPITAARSSSSAPRSEYAR